MTATTERDALEVRTAQHPTRPRRPHGGVPWPVARATAAAVAPLPARTLSIAAAIGRRLTAEVTALTDLPPCRVSAMDGWAVADAGPWQVVPDDGRPLATGGCAAVRTGAPVPPGADAVLPVEHSSTATDGRTLLVHRAVGTPWAAGQHVRTPGEEARQGDVLVAAGAVVTPTVAGLAAAAGHDTLAVRPAATVDVLVLGDELAADGLPAPGRTRDALGPVLPAWLAALGADVGTPRSLPDDLDLLCAAASASRADVLVTTGGTSVGATDHVRAAVDALGGRLLVDGVAVKPGHPMLLARPVGDRGQPRWWVALPGNPFAACAAVVTLLQPLLDALHGAATTPPSARLADDHPARAGDPHRLLPVTVGRDGRLVSVPACGSAMLRGLAAASGLAVVGPRGARAGEQVTYLPFPWTTTGEKTEKAEETDQWT
jgi:molybdopterin molybdotransferase